MGFDWQAFATGFLQQTAKNQTEAREDAREYEDRQRQLAERNAQTISKRRAVANQVVSLTNMLRDNGASDRVIQAAISAGPQEVATLANNEDDIETLVNVPEGFSVVDMDTEAFIKKTYGLGYQGAGVSNETVERSFMDRLTGRKLRDAARARLDSEVMVDGLTAYDINQMASQQDYESLVPGTFISFNDVKYFNPATDMSNFTRTFTSLVDDVENSAAFESIQTQIEQTRFDDDLDDKQREAKLAQLQKQKDELYLRSVGPTIDSMVTTYGDSFVESTRGFLGNYLSDDYLDSLNFNAAEEEEQASTVSPIDAQTDAALGGAVQPKVTVEELPAEEPRTQVTTIQVPIEGQEQPQEVEVVRTGAGLQIVDADGSLIDPEFSKKIIDKTQEFTYDQLDASYPEEGPMPEDVTTEEKNQSLTEPFTEGDPRPADGVMASPKEKYRAKVWDEMFGETHNPDGTRKDGTTPEATTTVDEESDVALLRNYGSSIMQHMDAAGLDVSSSDEDIRQELAAWYSDNSADLAVPSMVGVDDDIIISTIRKFLKEGSM
jgi:hypothetical protein